jgi:transcriptional regulator with XRE-family HTH domain|tara:strand:- start:322 stop:507 length:186 start_codon:yes stop_codon:yes gene_type:complete
MELVELRIRRIRAGLTQYRFAEKAGIHPSRLSEMETGKRPIAEAVVKALDKELAKASKAGT